MEIYEIIRAAMKNRHMTQEMFGKAMGLTQGTVSESTSRTPKPLADRVKMLDYLGYEVIVREKRQGRRAEGEYVVTVDPEKWYVTPKKKSRERKGE